MLEFMVFKNAHGQEAAPAQPVETEGPFKGDPVSAIPALDFERCQVVFGVRDTVRCDQVPTGVMVENNRRSSHGKIHSMAMCDRCATFLLISQGQDHGLFTPLVALMAAPYVPPKSPSKRKR